MSLYSGADYPGAGLQLWGDARVRFAVVVLSIHNGSLDWRWLHNVLGDMRRSEIRTVGLGLQLGLNVDAY